MSGGRIQHTAQVVAVKKQLRKIHPNNHRIFQMATKGLKTSSDSAFNGLPLGKNTIKEMKRISEKLGCPWSTQTTVYVQQLSNIWLMRQSQTQVQSLAAYAQRNSDSRKRQMADTERPPDHMQKIWTSISSRRALALASVSTS